jgi:hypothetical protein
MVWMRSKVGRFSLALAACLAFAGVGVLADGSVWITRTSTLVNPCNGELMTGLVDVHLLVQAQSDANGDHVVVHRNFSGTLTGNQGNSYKVSSIANDQFDALAPFYDLTFENNVKGHGSAPDFWVLGRMRVFVDADQNPVNYAAGVISATCK